MAALWIALGVMLIAVLISIHEKNKKRKGGN